MIVCHFWELILKIPRFWLNIYLDVIRCIIFNKYLFCGLFTSEISLICYIINLYWGILLTFHCVYGIYNINISCTHIIKMLIMYKLPQSFLSFFIILRAYITELCVCVCMFVCVCVCVCLSIRLSVCVSVFLYISICTNIYTYLCVCVLCLRNFQIYLNECFGSNYVSSDVFLPWASTTVKIVGTHGI